MEWFLKRFIDLTPHEIHEIFKLRVDIFVVEQICPYPEIDGKDFDAWHLFCIDDNSIVAYARLLAPGISFKESSIGRVVVKKTYRNKKIGFELIEKAVIEVSKLYGESIQIGAQAHLEKFYESVGFIKNSDIYLEDDIPHIDMIKKKN